MNIPKDPLIDPVAVVLGQRPLLAGIAGNDQEIEQQRLDRHLGKPSIPERLGCPVAVAILIERPITLVERRAKILLGQGGRVLYRHLALAVLAEERRVQRTKRRHMQKRLVPKPTHRTRRLLRCLRPTQRQRHQTRLSPIAVGERKPAVQGPKELFGHLQPRPIRPRHLIEAVEYQKQRLRIIPQPSDRARLQHAVIGTRLLDIIIDDLVDRPIHLQPLQRHHQHVHAARKRHVPREPKRTARLARPRPTRHHPKRIARTPRLEPPLQRSLQPRDMHLVLLGFFVEHVAPRLRHVSPRRFRLDPPIAAKRLIDRPKRRPAAVFALVKERLLFDLPGKPATIVTLPGIPPILGLPSLPRKVVAKLRKMLVPIGKRPAKPTLERPIQPLLEPLVIPKMIRCHLPRPARQLFP